MIYHVSQPPLLSSLFTSQICIHNLFSMQMLDRNLLVNWSIFDGFLWNLWLLSTCSMINTASTPKRHCHVTRQLGYNKVILCLILNLHRFVMTSWSIVHPTESKKQVNAVKLTLVSSWYYTLTSTYCRPKYHCWNLLKYHEFIFLSEQMNCF